MSAHFSTSSPGTITRVAAHLEGLRRGRCPRAAEALVQARAVERVVLGSEEQRQPAVAELGGQGHVLRAFGGEVDRQIGPQRVDRRLQRLPEPETARVGQLVVLALEVDRLVAGDDLADDGHVLAGAGERLGVGLAVPALHDLRARGAEAEDEPTAGQVVEGHRRHRRGRRSAGRHLGDGRAELDVLGARAPPGQRHQGVRAVRLGRPDRVEPQPFGLQDRRQRLRRRSRPPVPRVQPKLHDRTVPRRPRPPAVPRAGEVRYRARVPIARRTGTRPGGRAEQPMWSPAR